MDLDEGVNISPNPPDPAGGLVSFNSIAQPRKKLGQTEKKLCLKEKYLYLKLESHAFTMVWYILGLLCRMP